ncbi:hypothetical protein cand_028450 [Cryptosporidium andersoni]|uniref:E3 ubiquitin-protein ligase n=1 Tax=Cryptosporidium andersoni TaxID=117008 RepID=A0A1J4MRH4_9CRYT|nr:hypothetical protein cand_028450 [Cryptosporidium andersoni]
MPIREIEGNTDRIDSEDAFYSVISSNSQQYDLAIGIPKIRVREDIMNEWFNINKGCNLALLALRFRLLCLKIYMVRNGPIVPKIFYHGSTFSFDLTYQEYEKLFLDDFAIDCDADLVGQLLYLVCMLSDHPNITSEWISFLTIQLFSTTYSPEDEKSIWYMAICNKSNSELYPLPLEERKWTKHVEALRRDDIYLTHSIINTSTILNPTNGTLDFFIISCLQLLMDPLYNNIENIFCIYPKDIEVFSIWRLPSNIPLISRCSQVWSGQHIAYRCLTCGTSSSSCICVKCFQSGNHEGHDYYIYKSDYGGCCDCGDEQAWNSGGFCTHHKGSTDINKHKELDDFNELKRSKNKLREILKGLLHGILCHVVCLSRLYCTTPPTKELLLPFNSKLYSRALLHNIDENENHFLFEDQEYNLFAENIESDTAPDSESLNRTDTTNNSPSHTNGSLLQTENIFPAFLSIEFRIGNTFVILHRDKYIHMDAYFFEWFIYLCETYPTIFLELLGELLGSPIHELLLNYGDGSEPRTSKLLQPLIEQRKVHNLIKEWKDIPKLLALIHPCWRRNKIENITEKRLGCKEEGKINNTDNCDRIEDQDYSFDTDHKLDIIMEEESLKANPLSCSSNSNSENIFVKKFVSYFPLYNRNNLPYDTNTSISDSKEIYSNIDESKLNNKFSIPYKDTVDLINTAHEKYSNLNNNIKDNKDKGERLERLYIRNKDLLNDKLTYLDAFWVKWSQKLLNTGQLSSLITYKQGDLTDLLLMLMFDFNFKSFIFPKIFLRNYCDLVKRQDKALTRIAVQLFTIEKILCNMVLHGDLIKILFGTTFQVLQSSIISSNEVPINLNNLSNRSTHNTYCSLESTRDSESITRESQFLLMLNPIDPSLTRRRYSYPLHDSRYILHSTDLLLFIIFNIVTPIVQEELFIKGIKGEEIFLKSEQLYLDFWHSGWLALLRLSQYINPHKSHCQSALDDSVWHSSILFCCDIVSSVNGIIQIIKFLIDILCNNTSLNIESLRSSLNKYKKQTKEISFGIYRITVNSIQALLQWIYLVSVNEKWNVHYEFYDNFCTTTFLSNFYESSKFDNVNCFGKFSWNYKFEYESNRENKIIAVSNHSIIKDKVSIHLPLHRTTLQLLYIYIEYNYKIGQNNEGKSDKLNNEKHQEDFESTQKDYFYFKKSCNSVTPFSSSLLSIEDCLKSIGIFNETTLLCILEHPIRSYCFAYQAFCMSNVWVRNGLAPVNEAQFYKKTYWATMYLISDLFIIRFILCFLTSQVSKEILLKSLLQHFDIYEEVTPNNKVAYEKKLGDRTEILKNMNDSISNFELPNNTNRRFWQIFCDEISPNLLSCANCMLDIIVKCCTIDLPLCLPYDMIFLKYVLLQSLMKGPKSRSEIQESLSSYSSNLIHSLATSHMEYIDATLNKFCVSISATETKPLLYQLQQPLGWMIYDPTFPLASFNDLLSTDELLLENIRNWNLNDTKRRRIGDYSFDSQSKSICYNNKSEISTCTSSNSNYPSFIKFPLKVAYLPKKNFFLINRYFEFSSSRIVKSTLISMILQLQCEIFNYSYKNTIVADVRNIQLTAHLLFRLIILEILQKCLLTNFYIENLIGEDSLEKLYSSFFTLGRVEYGEAHCNTLNTERTHKNCENTQNKYKKVDISTDTQRCSNEDESFILAGITNEMCYHIYKIFASKKQELLNSCYTIKSLNIFELSRDMNNLENINIFELLLYQFKLEGIFLNSENHPISTSSFCILDILLETIYSTRLVSFRNNSVLIKAPKFITEEMRNHIPLEASFFFEWSLTIAKSCHPRINQHIDDYIRSTFTFDYNMDKSSESDSKSKSKVFMRQVAIMNKYAQKRQEFINLQPSAILDGDLKDQNLHIQDIKPSIHIEVDQSDIADSPSCVFCHEKITCEDNSQIFTFAYLDFQGLSESPRIRLHPKTDINDSLSSNIETKLIKRERSYSNQGHPISLSSSPYSEQPSSGLIFSPVSSYISLYLTTCGHLIHWNCIRQYQKLQIQQEKTLANSSHNQPVINPPENDVNFSNFPLLPETRTIKLSVLRQNKISCNEATNQDNEETQTTPNMEICKELKDSTSAYPDCIIHTLSSGKNTDNCTIQYQGTYHYTYLLCPYCTVPSNIVLPVFLQNDRRLNQSILHHTPGNFEVLERLLNLLNVNKDLINNENKNFPSVYCTISSSTVIQQLLPLLHSTSLILPCYIVSDKIKVGNYMLNNPLSLISKLISDNILIESQNLFINGSSKTKMYRILIDMFQSICLTNGSLKISLQNSLRNTLFNNKSKIDVWEFAALQSPSSRFQFAIASILSFENDIVPILTYFLVIEIFCIIWTFWNNDWFELDINDANEEQFDDHLNIKSLNPIIEIIKKLKKHTNKKKINPTEAKALNFFINLIHGTSYNLKYKHLNLRKNENSEEKYIYCIAKEWKTINIATTPYGALPIQLEMKPIDEQNLEKSEEYQNSPFILKSKTGNFNSSEYPTIDLESLLDSDIDKINLNKIEFEEISSDLINNINYSTSLSDTTSLNQEKDLISDFVEHISKSIGTGLIKNIKSLNEVVKCGILKWMSCITTFLSIIKNKENVSDKCSNILQNLIWRISEILGNNDIKELWNELINLESVHNSKIYADILQKIPLFKLFTTYNNFIPMTYLDVTTDNSIPKDSCLYKHPLVSHMNSSSFETLLEFIKKINKEYYQYTMLYWKIQDYSIIISQYYQFTLLPPKVYHSLYNKLISNPTLHWRSLDLINTHQLIICLTCGATLCTENRCCNESEVTTLITSSIFKCHYYYPASNSDNNDPDYILPYSIPSGSSLIMSNTPIPIRDHIAHCGRGLSFFLHIPSSLVLALRLDITSTKCLFTSFLGWDSEKLISGGRVSYMSTLYVDEYGEEDKNLARGKPLYLCPHRWTKLQNIQYRYSVRRNTKFTWNILQSFDITSSEH